MTENRLKKLNFGAGKDIRNGWDNVDRENFDFNKFPYPIKTNAYDEIEARQVLQLLDNPERVLQELWRISKSNSIIYIQIAYFNNKGAHNDIKTKYYFNENSFKFFVEHPAETSHEKLFEIISLYREPSWFLKWCPNWILDKIDLFLSGIYQDIHVKLKVKKLGQERSHKYGTPPPGISRETTKFFSRTFLTL